MIEQDHSSLPVPEWFPASTHVRDFVRRPARSTRYQFELARVIGGLLPSAGALSILDVGCGEGLIGGFLTAFRPHTAVYGAEVRPRKRRAPTVPQILFDGRTLPFRDREFDYVLACDVLHHAPSRSSMRALAVEMTRLARHGVIIKDHISTSRLDRWKLLFLDMLGNFRDGVPVPGNYLAWDEWQELLRFPGCRPADAYTRLPVMAAPFRLLCGDRLQAVFFIGMLEGRTK